MDQEISTLTESISWRIEAAQCSIINQAISPFLGRHVKVSMSDGLPAQGTIMDGAYDPEAGLHFEVSWQERGVNLSKWIPATGLQPWTQQ